MFHTATLLSDGRVLIAAGGDATADLYDPKTGTFSPTGSMSGLRSGATATLLSDGRVLIAGGSGASAVLASAELYDPKTGKFAATGSMESPRSNATAALLSDGRVLVVGGNDALGATAHKSLASAELYDSKTGKFTVAGSMKDGRQDHTASLLPDGRVLIAGGFTDSGSYIPLASAELYDPCTDEFSATGSMTVAGAIQTATRLSDGRVLIVGGAGVVVQSQATFVNPAELYDPKTGKFAATGSLKEGRTHATATLLADGRVLVMGGDIQSGILQSVESYDPATGTFTAAGQMTVARFSQTATVLQDGRILIAGGRDRTGNPLASAELCQP
jgi:WD40 repeat protein